MCKDIYANTIRRLKDMAILSAINAFILILMIVSLYMIEYIWHNILNNTA